MKNFLKRFDLLGIAALTVAVFILINLLVSPFSFRLDFSKGQAYTLSKSSKKILDNLEDVVTIKFFVSSDIPTRLLPIKNQVVDLLNEYQKENRGKVTIKILDPKTDQNAANDARNSGLPQLQFSQLEQDKYAITSSYFGIIVSYTNKKEVLPQVADISSLEYNLSATIYKMTRKAEVKIAVFGQQEDTNLQTDKLSTLKKILRQQFTLDFIDVATGAATQNIDSSYKTILVFDTKKQFDGLELEAIKNYLNLGGKAIFFADGIWVNDDLATTPAQNDLRQIFQNYGITINPDLVLSTSAELVNFGGGLVSFLAPYPFWLKTNSFNTKTAYFSNISSLTFPWVSSIGVSGKATSLVQTSKRSWEQKDTFQLDPQNIPQPQNSQFKQFTIVAKSSSDKKGEIIVIPSSRFILDKFLSQTSDNLGFVLNVVDDFASSGALSGINQRALSFYPLPDIPNSQKNIFKYLNILLLPSLFAIFGAIKLIKG